MKYLYDIFIANILASFWSLFIKSIGKFFWHNWPQGDPYQVYWNDSNQVKTVTKEMGARRVCLLIYRKYVQTIAILYWPDLKLFRTNEQRVTLDQNKPSQTWVSGVESCYHTKHSKLVCHK